MFDFNSGLFWYKFIFITEILAGEALFIFLFKGKRNILFQILFLIGVYLFTFLMPTSLPFIKYDAIYVSFLFLILFASSLVYLKFCFDESWGTILFCGIMAYTVQHLSYITGNFLTMVFNLNIESIYESSISSVSGIFLLIDGAIFLVFYALLSVFVKKFFKKETTIRVNIFALIILSMVMLLVEVFINSIIIFMNVKEFSIFLSILCYIYDLIVCFLIMGVLIFSVYNKTLKYEKDITVIMWNKEKECYNIKKEKMEEINIMCHDLKHRIREMEEVGYANSQLEKLQDAIKTYDSFYETGNDVLNIILSEANIVCEKNGIRFICIADGKLLNFMSTEHIYSLFDNAINNAIDAVKNLNDPEKKNIKLHIIKKNALISIHLENYYDENNSLYFKDGIPQTTKNQVEGHGFGMKSIQLIVENYKGGLNVSTKDKIFNLDIFFPC